MVKIKSKIFALLLALIMLAGVPSFTACSDPENNAPPDVTTAAPAAETTDAPKSKYDIGDALPNTLQFDGETVKIISRGRDWVNDEITVEEDDTASISVAVNKRNRIVEQRLGVKIENYKTGGTDNFEISNIIRNQAKTGHEYDLLANSTYATIMYSGENCFGDLKKLDHLDLSRPYWLKGFNEAVTYQNKQFFCAGAIVLSSYRFIFTTMFNKSLFEQHEGNPDLYQVVNDQKWTIDYQRELIAQFWKDENANGISDQGDFLGFMTNADTIGVDAYWSSCRLPILANDADGRYIYAVDVERTTNAIEKLNAMMWDTEGTYAIPKMSGDSEQQVIAKEFAEDHVAMVTLRLIEIEGEDIRNMLSYGILPIPKLNEEQEGYYSFAHDSMTSVAMANTVPADKRELIGAFLEAMASESYKTVTPAYYEVALKSRYAKDPASWEMLDLITEHLDINAGMLYSDVIGSPHRKMRTLVGTNAKNTAAILKGMKKMTETKIATLNKDLDNATGE